MLTISEMSDQLVDDGGDATQPDGDWPDMQNIIILDHDARHNVNNLVHTGGNLQEAAFSTVALETSEGDEDPPTDRINSTVHVPKLQRRLQLYFFLFHEFSKYLGSRVFVQKHNFYDNQDSTQLDTCE